MIMMMMILAMGPMMGQKGSSRKGTFRASDPRRRCGRDAKDNSGDMINRVKAILITPVRLMSVGVKVGGRVEESGDKSSGERLSPKREKKFPPWRDDFFVDLETNMKEMGEKKNFKG